jgi:phosphorylcholine metabolism protein LicD
LGLIRDKALIHWDFDIDICILNKDLGKLLDLNKSAANKEKFKLKIINKGKIWKIKMDDIDDIWVDVFPLYICLIQEY